MIKFKHAEGLRMPSKNDLPFLLLLVAGIMELFYISMESLFSYIGYYLVEDYIIVPCLLFVGIALMRELTPFAKRQMLLAAAAVAWFTVVQMIHKLSGMGTHPIGTVFFVYLMAFPFAPVTDDRENRGMKIIGWVFVAAAMVQVFYTVLLVLDCVPAVLTPYVYWDGARLHVFWHPNITACYLMIGIGFAVCLIFLTEKKWVKILLAVMVLLQFIAMGLTNCRTTLLLTSAFFGSIGFFLVYKGGWKRFFIGLIAVLAVTVCLFKTAGAVYEWNHDVQTEKLRAKLENEETRAEVTQYYTINPETGEAEVYSKNGQGTLSGDMRTLNGRTGIWKAALEAIRDDLKLLLWGTEYANVVVTAYHRFKVAHTHNSWMETLLRLGAPGLMIALTVTWMAVRSAWILAWNSSVALWKKSMAIVTMCVMVAGFLEPYLFITNVYYHVTDFAFFFCTGYLNYWRKQLSENK